MPRYVLHQIHRKERIEDFDGAGFESLAAAREEAILGAREIMAARLLAGVELDHSRFEICDESQTVLLIFPFLEAIPHESEDG